MMFYDDIGCFVKLVEVGSYHKAADKMNISPATLTRRIQNLESKINVVLLVRNAKKFCLTTEGQLLYSKFKDLDKNLNEVLAVYNAKDSTDADTLNVVLPLTLSSKLITPYISKFKDKYPDVNLIVNYETSPTNLLNSNVDLIMTHHKTSHSKFDYRFLRKENINLYCTPNYILQNGYPTTVSELSNHKIINGVDYESLKKLDYLLFTNKNTGEKVYYNLSDTKLHINNLDHAKEIGLNDTAIFGGLESLCKEEVMDGRLVQVLPDYEVLSVDYYLISRKKLRGLEQQFIDFLYKCMNGTISK